MVRNYELTEQAEKDLDEIYDTIAADNAMAADQFVDILFDAMDSLARMPGIGHVRSDLTSLPVRFWPVRRYLIIYREEVVSVTILRVVSAYRDIVALL